MKFAILVSRYNGKITKGLLSGAETYFSEQKLDPHQLEIFHLPGAFELPLAAKKLALTRNYSGVVCLGCVIKGETAHFEFISLATTMGLMQAMLDTEIPISFGILTTYTEEQAGERSLLNAENKGREAAAACWESSQFLKRFDSK